MIFSVELLNFFAQVWNLLNSRHKGAKGSNKIGGVSYRNLKGIGVC